MKEKISALMDGDLVLEDAEYLMTALKTNGEAAKSWDAYHLIGDVMRGSNLLTPGMTSRVMQEIAKQPVVIAPKVRFPGNTTNLWSMVASVAAIFFVSLVIMHQQTQEAKNAPIEIAQNVPSEYLLAHQSMSPSNTAYFIQSASFIQDK